MIPNLAAALAGRRKYVDDVSESVTSYGAGTGNLSDAIRSGGASRAARGAAAARARR
jgi:hypothetical protein